MAGSLSGLNTALSALQYNRVVMDVASNNVANAGTDGYVRRRAVGESIGSSAVPALWSRVPGAEGGVGSGVRVGSIDRMADPYLDARARREHGAQSYLDTRSAVLQRVESGFGEPGNAGVAAAITAFRSSWHDLANSPNSEAARGLVISRGQALASAVNAQANALDAEMGDQRLRLLGHVVDVNTTAAELAATNRAIATARLDGADTGSLADQRDQLALRLADLAGGTATARADGGFDVTVNGVALVTGSQAGTLAIASGVTPAGAADGAPVTFAITMGPTTTTVPAGLSGVVGATEELLTTTLPGYAADLSTVVAGLADQVNTVHQAGYDRTGTAGQPFFTYTAGNAAGTLAVAITDPSAVAASGVAGGAVDGSNAAALGTAGSAEESYRRLVTGFGSQVASVKQLAATQRLLTAQVDNAREQLSGVSLDEEMVTMLSAQRAYEAAARVMTVVDSVLDTLINRTGVTR
ncbi:flagellar hook-associated protein FlgK [Nocardioides sp. R-C-SC26]|uniref:flagellar hook-associated protein FlgK n=1 Tax=Nocardioides sp. R-C-SC26 TaxID=2870414 RepID=UPI001E29942D|nr:flagellar hook-associated protein FlgK [Nocardioides sp. R-C-SC26]